MRLIRLDLTRYGKFTDHSLAFGDRPSGSPDLHVVYGPNEAGKSTALSALLDLLFGIEPRSRYDFLHPYPTMRIGARLELADGERELVRIKRAQGTLLDGDGQPVSDGLIAADLGGIDRDAYRSMFSLDDDTIEAGGESILASKGELGQLLFSASAGLADLSRTLLALRAEADGFHRHRGRGTELSLLKADLADLRKEREAIDTAASEYAQLVESRDRAAAQYAEAMAERGTIRARLNDIERRLNALPRLSALRAARERLAPLSDLPPAPLGWVDELPSLQRREVELATRSEALDREIEEIEADLGGAVVDDAALAVADRLDGLAGLRARHVTAETDLPERRLQLRAVDLAVAGILHRLGRPDHPDPGRLVVDATTVGSLRELIETRSGVAAAAGGATAEVARAREQLAEARSALAGSAGAVPADPSRDAAMATLVSVLASLRGSDHAARRRLAERSRATHRDALAERLSGLLPWQGTSDQLIGLVVPDAGEVGRWSAQASRLQAQAERHEQDIERRAGEACRLRAEIEAMAGIAGVVDDHEAVAIRSLREQAWATHRRALDAGSADAFEAALRRDDIAAAARLGHQKDIVTLHQARQALAVVAAEQARLGDLLSAARRDRAAVDAAVEDSLAAMMPRLPAGVGPEHLQAWLTRRDRALEAVAGLRQAERDIRDAEADATAARQRLAGALAAAGLPHDPDAGFDVLVGVAEVAVEREAEFRSLRAAVVERERDLLARERALEAAAAAERAWQTAWSGACTACWIGENEPVPAEAAVREILVALTDLGPTLEKQAALADRIRKMEDDQAAFRDAVLAIARDLEVDPAGRSASELERVIAARIAAARADAAARSARAAALAAARARRRELDEALAIHAGQRDRMTAFFGARTLAEVGERLQQTLTRAELQGRVEEAEREILDAVRLASIAAAEEALDAADRSALEAELAELAARFDDQDQRTRDLFAAQARAADRVEAVGGDDAVARIEERRRTALLEVEDKARRYLRLRVGVVAAEQALRVYRDEHRSSMMARASEAFRTISRGAYSGLATQPDRDGDSLIAVAADGGSKIASDLSKGTRFQLYLALRLAGYHEFARARRPVPFVADDIMETFDDFRAEEAFRLFAEMAETGQVIYLTHHRHLCEVAQRVCPTLRLHELPTAP